MNSDVDKLKNYDFITKCYQFVSQAVITRYLGCLQTLSLWLNSPINSNKKDFKCGLKNEIRVCSEGSLRWKLVAQEGSGNPRWTRIFFTGEISNDVMSGKRNVTASMWISVCVRAAKFCFLLGFHLCGCFSDFRVTGGDILSCQVPCFQQRVAVQHLEDKCRRAVEWARRLAPSVTSLVSELTRS